MKTVELKGEDYRRFSKIVYFNNKNKTSDLTELDNWNQPLNFTERMVLRQTKAGPCGLFAVLNSHVILGSTADEETTDSPQDILNNLILDIFKRVSTYIYSQDESKSIYVFCDTFEPKLEFIHFQYTDSYDEALNFLKQTNYTSLPNACLLITLSIIFASIRMNEFCNVPEEPYIVEDKMTSMALVWLMLNGSVSDDNLEKTEKDKYAGIAQKEIGIKVLSHLDERVIGTWLNPEASIFVCLSFYHFFAILNTDDQTIVYDSMNGKSPYLSKNKV